MRGETGSTGSPTPSQGSYDSDLAAALDDEFAAAFDEARASGQGAEELAAEGVPGAPIGERPGKRQRPDEAPASAPAPLLPPLGGASGQASAAVPPKPPPAASSRCPPHPAFVGGLCVRCGAEKPEGDGHEQQQGYGHTDGGDDVRGAPTIVVKHLHDKRHIEVCRAEAQRLMGQAVAQLLAHRKLLLVLDLDHTLVNSVRLGDVAPEHAAKLEAMLQAEAEQVAAAAAASTDVAASTDAADAAATAPSSTPTPPPSMPPLPSRRRHLHKLEAQGLWTKVRPGVFEMLEALRDRYQMAIYTMGDKRYADLMAGVLDPERRLFAGRVVSAADSTSAVAKDLDIMLSSDAHVAILDDTEGVWPNHRRNLMQVDRYHFFPASAKVWGGVSLLETGGDEPAGQGGMMAAAAAVLADVHDAFFDEHQQTPLASRDIRDALKRRRQQTLAACHLVFSGCWSREEAQPYRQPLWALAEGLGADCSMHYDRDITTHVVAGLDNTDKVHAARRDGKHVVGPSWLAACSYRWTRAPEHAHPIPKDGKAKAAPAMVAAAAPRGPPAPLSTRTAAFSSGKDAVGGGDAAEELLRVLRAAGGGSGGAPTLAAAGLGRDK